MIAGVSLRLLNLPFQFIRRVATSRAFWLGGPLLLYAWTIGGPFITDDHLLILRAERFLRGESKSCDIYRIAPTEEAWRELRDRGSLMWWMPDRGRFDYFRPVSGLGVIADAALARRNPLVSRLLGLAVFAAALLSVHWLFSVAGEDGLRAGAATFFFGISQTLTPPITWLNNRQDLFVIIGVSLAAGAYWKMYRDPRWRWLLLAAAAYAFALLSKEMAVGLAAIIGLHALVWMRKREPSAGRTRSIAVAMTLIGLLLLFLIYYMVSRPWVLSGAGEDGLPSQLGLRSPLAALLLTAVWSLGFPIDALHIAPEWIGYLVAAASGAVLIVTMPFLRRACRGDRAALFFALWAIIFLLPGLRAFSPPSARTISTATVGWAYLLAAMILPRREEDLSAPPVLRLWLLAANGTISICCVIATVLIMNHGEGVTRTQLMQAVARLNPPLADRDVVVIPQAESNGGMPCAGDRLEILSGGRDVGVIYLFPPEIDAALDWLDHDTLRARAGGISLLGGPIHRISLGREWRPRAGQTFPREAFTAEVTKLDANGGAAEMTFRFDSKPGGRRVRLGRELQATRP